MRAGIGERCDGAGMTHDLERVVLILIRQRLQEE
jgi:hypothetical protein